MTMRLELATIFIDAQKAQGKLTAARTGLDTVAARFIAYLAAEKVDTVEKLDDVVSAAYAQNKWTRRQGRPKAGDTPAPHVVGVYVSTVRRALGFKIKIANCKNMEEIRRAINLKKPAPKTDPELIGVQVTEPHTLTGVLWHDVIVVRDNLTANKQQELEAKVRKLLDQYLKSAQMELRLVA